MNRILLAVATAVTVMALRAGAAYSNPPYTGEFRDDITPEVKAAVSDWRGRRGVHTAPIVPPSNDPHMTYAEARGFVTANNLEAHLCAEIDEKLFGPPAVSADILGLPVIKAAAQTIAVWDCKEKGSGDLVSRFLGQVTGTSAEEALRHCYALPSAYGGQFRRVWVENGRLLNPHRAQQGPMICDCKEKGSGSLFPRVLSQVTGATPDETLRACHALPSTYGRQFRRVWVDSCKTFSQ